VVLPTDTGQLAGTIETSRGFAILSGASGHVAGAETSARPHRRHRL